MGKYELKMMFLDEWMLRWRKFQTESDWEVEKDRQWWRRTNMGIVGAVFTGLIYYTTGVATARRQFGLPHFFDVGVDAKMKASLLDNLVTRWRYTPQGYGRVLVTGIPTYMLFVGLEHYQEGRRLRRYLELPTIFGEQARRFVETGKIEEFLPVNIQASLPNGQTYLRS